MTTISRDPLLVSRPADGDAGGGRPETAEDFALALIGAICCASVTPAAGRRTYQRCLQALGAGATVRMGFRHPGKADAIDRIWRERRVLFRDFRAAADQAAFLAGLPWIGPVTLRRLCQRFQLVELPERPAAALIRAAA